MASYSTWRVGTITVPGSTGSMSVTGLGGTPEAVFFYGTNWTTEDSKVSGSGYGMFRGMAAPKWDSPSTIVQNAAAVIPTGDAHVTDTGLCIRMPDTSGTFSSYLYHAILTSFDADGFTISWTAVSSGYKVVYVALMNAENVGAYEGGTTTLSVGWKAGASLLHGAWGALPGVGGSDRTQEFYGGAAYPGADSLGWNAAGVSAYTFPTSVSAQYNIGLFNFRPTIVVAQDGSFLGPSLVAGNVLAYPSGGSLTEFVMDFNESGTGGMVVLWDDEDNWTGKFTVPASTSGTHTESGLSFAPGLLLGYTTSDEPDGQGTGGRGALGFSVITPDFQWCCVSDNGQAYQSFQRGICDVVASGGVHTATVELTGDGFITTTDDDDVSPDEWVWHAFGHPTPTQAWLPHIYRMLVAHGAAGSVLSPSYLGLEEGDRILLEDGSGYLIL